jgi:FMN phosphatase YigB (HAD superfamily)
MTIRVSDFDAVTFDVYGTLIDWEPSIVEFLQQWSRRHGINLLSSRHSGFHPRGFSTSGKAYEQTSLPQTSLV